MGKIRFVGTVETRGYPYLVCKKKNPIAPDILVLGIISVVFFFHIDKVCCVCVLIRIASMRRF